MAVIVPPQAWLQVREQFGYGGSYLDFLRLYFSALRRLEIGKIGVSKAVGKDQDGPSTESRRP
jgi:hypothetical protein